MEKTTKTERPASPVKSNELAWPSTGAERRANETEVEFEERVARIAQSVKQILVDIGEDPSREGILKTPERYARALMFLTRGYQQSLPMIINDAIFEENHDEMVIVKDIEVNSMCEHHLVPIIGSVSIGYIPNKRVIGLSKLARIADMFGQRLQVQERLTKQIAMALMKNLEPRGVGVILKASY